MLVISAVAQGIGEEALGDIGVYLGPLMVSIWVARVIVARKISLGKLVGRIPGGYNWWPLVLIAIGGIVYSIGALPVVWYPIAKLDPELAGQLLTEKLVESPLHFFILAVVLAPLVEETVFRGLLFSRLTTKWRMTKAILISSALFGLLHLDPIGAFVFGVVACVLYVRTQTLMVPMALHALTNAIVFSLTLVAGDSAYSSTDFRDEFVYQGLVAMLLASPVVFALLGRWWPPHGARLPYDANRLQSEVQT